MADPEAQARAVADALGIPPGRVHTRVWRILKQEGIETAVQLAEIPPREMFRWPGLGHSTYQAIEDGLIRMALWPAGGESMTTGELIAQLKRYDPALPPRILARRGILGGIKKVDLLAGRVVIVASEIMGVK